MSELCKAIYAEDTGVRRARPGRFSVKEGFVPLDANEMSVYAIKVCLESRAEVSRWLGGEELQAVVVQAKRSIVEAVFGEFRLPLRDVADAIIRGDGDEALKLVSKVENQMFSIDDGGVGR